jgi:hypothetical protein
VKRAEGLVESPATARRPVVIVAGEWACKAKFRRVGNRLRSVRNREDDWGPTTFSVRFDEFLLAASVQNLRKLAKLIPEPAPAVAG